MGKQKPRKSLKLFALVLVAAAVVAVSGAYVALRGSLPKLEGVVVAPGVSAPISVARDDHGVPTVKGRTRADLAFALGYLHAQERFFEMDLQRRAAAGELSELVGRAALPRDGQVRLHRFRHRAAAVLEAMTPDERRTLDAYVVGVNLGLRELRAAPFEYFLLATEPAPWTAEDSILVVYAMYLTLQDPQGVSERRRADAVAALGQPLAEFLFPEGTSWDAALDGSFLPTPEMPVAGLKRTGSLAPSGRAFEEAETPGSNGFAVGGALGVEGAAIVAGDMHLGLREPNLWYRARLVVDAGDGAVPLDVAGVTLPGAPNVVAGSNGRVAWAFTNAQVDTSDVVILEPVAGDSSRYLTPTGPKTLTRVEERLCPNCAESPVLTVEESEWGPVIGADAQGRKLAYRWIAHDPIAVNLRGSLDLERAASAREALDIAHRLGIPHQNMVAGDVEGNVGWTVTTALPRRVGHDGRYPASWADGRSGWSGYLDPAETPVIYNPANRRIWTANARVVGGEALQKLGFDAYVHGARAGQIRDDLLARERFAESDLLAIQLDDRALLLDRWRDLLLQSLRARVDRLEFAGFLHEVEIGSDQAAPRSVGYRLVRDFRRELITSIYRGYMANMPALEGPATDRTQVERFPTKQADEPAWRLLSQRPPHLVPPGFRDWDAVVDAALERLVSTVKTEAGGRLEAFTWGEANRAGVRHPLVRALPALDLLLDPPDEPLPGDLYQPRVAAPGFGASVRFVVSPGHEARGLLHMPTGQSGNPLSP
ncbi:MAG TPA: penicillin acylase family protein, partial [Methylocystis sp.]|nr:penicillin acylase family protein [Methylocystis sp.]